MTPLLRGAAREEEIEEEEEDVVGEVEVVEEEEDVCSGSGGEAEERRREEEETKGNDVASVGNEEIQAEGEAREGEEEDEEEAEGVGGEENEDEDDEAEEEEGEGEDEEDDGSEEEDDGDVVYDAKAVHDAYSARDGDIYEGLDASDVAWTKRLFEWLDCFTDASIKWTQVKRGGQQRHGLLVTLMLNVSVYSMYGISHPVNLAKMREAIDLARLLVIVKPAVIRSTIRRLEGSKLGAPTFSRYEEELEALVRGVPVDFRVKLSHSSLKAYGMDKELAQFFFQELQLKTPTDKGFVLAWMELSSLLLRKCSLDECNRTLGTPVNVVMVIDSSEHRGATELDSIQFNTDVTRFVKRLSEYCQQQTSRAWALDARLAPLCVQKIKLTLRSLCVTPRTLRRIKSIMKTGIPVKCSSVTICPRHIVNHQLTVQAFVDALATSAIDITTETAMIVDPIDTNGKDHTKLIRMVIEVIASVKQLDRVCMSGLLKVYGSSRNREAVWRGLFEVVLSRASPIKDLTFASDVPLTTEDAELISKCAATWRIWNPTKKLCLRTLHIALSESVPAPVLALLTAFDDMQYLWIEDDYIGSRQLPHETLVRALQFPSLRRLTLENIAIESMDVFDATVTDPRFPSRPVLEEIDLQHVTIADKDSLRRFISKLAPNSSCPHPLATSLRWLVIYQKNRTVPDGVVFDYDMATALHDALLQNSVLEHVNFVVDENDRSMHKHRQQFLVHNGRHVRASDYNCRSEVVKSRHLAFLSVLREGLNPGGSARATSFLDSHILRLIFDFSAPHVYRHVEVCESFEEEENDWEEL